MHGPASQQDLLQAHLERCLVQVTVGGRHSGSGFFVALGTVLTCAHVVARPGEVGVVWEGSSLPARVLRKLPEHGGGDPYPYPDLALLKVDGASHPCVRLDRHEPRLGPPAADSLRALGYTQVFARGEPRLTPITFEFEGVLRGGDGPRLQVKRGQTVEGMSGAPLLSERTCRVVGIVTTTRARTDDRGAWAVPAATILELLAIDEEHEAFHVGDESWRLAAAAHLGGVLRPAWEELPRQVDRAPSLLLRAKYAVVPFHSRAAELDELERWCADPAAPALHLVVGAGGAGKTRLAVELCRRMQTQGWLTGFLADEAESSAFDRVRELQEPTLLVLDYAETRGSERLGALIQRLADSSPNRPPLRLLLLARAAGDWWQTELPTNLRDPELVLAAVSVRVLGPAARSLDDRVWHYRTAADAFLAVQGMPARDVVVPDLGRPEFDVVLHLHMAALDAVGTPQDARPGPAALGWQSPLAAMLQREGRYWRRSADARSLRHQDRVLRRTVAVATLFGAEDEGNAAAVLARVPDLAGSPAEPRRDLARWHRDLYFDQQWLAPLQPDLLAEELVAEVLADSPELRSGGFRELTPAQAERALTLLDRAANRRSHDLQPMLREILASDPESLAPSVITVAIQTGGPIGSLLAEVLEEGRASMDSLLGLASEVPYPTTGLREVGAVLAAHAVRIARTIGDEADLAASLNDLSVRLGDLGRREPALNAIEEAVDVYRRLAEARPDAFLPGLASSLNNFSSSLGELGRWENALVAIEEAVDVYRRLAEDRPDAFLPDLAGSLHNLSLRLGDLGRREHALVAIEEAVAVYRRLAGDRPTFLPDLALCLNSLSVHLAALGRREPALDVIEEAVAVYRRLIDDRLDAFLPDLAMSLSNLSARLADVGRREHALVAIEEAVSVCRRLAEDRPDAFLPNLAKFLNNLSASLEGQGQLEHALVAIEEAVAVYRRLAEVRPDAYLPNLATFLNNLSTLLGRLRRWEPALDAVEEAVAVCRPLANAQPDAFTPNLAMSLNNLSNCLAEVGRYEPALAAIDETVRVYRRLAEARPDAFLPDLAMSLNNLSLRLAKLGRREEALTAIQEAIEIRSRLAALYPAALGDGLSRSLEVRRWLIGLPSGPPHQ